MQKKIRTILADDFSLFREGMMLLLAQIPEIELVGEAANGKELIREVETKQPDVVIVDIEMPVMNGIEATRELKDKYPMMGVIALTMFSDDYLVVDMIEAGANGYLIKNTSREELLEAVHIAAKGGYYFCNNTTFRLSKLIARSKTNPFKPGNGLTTKEIDIIKLICQQYASKEIAPMTHLTEGSVEAARHTIMEKTGAKNVVGIVIYAIQHGIYKIP